MKKSLLLAILFPLAVVSLTGCVKYNGKNKDGSPKNPTTTTTTTTGTSDTSSTDTSTEPPVPPAPTGSINLYLVLGPNGLYEGAAGTTYASKYLVNTKVITVERGSILPGKDKVTSTVSGSTFSHWVDRGSATTVATAPDAEEAVLVAVFEGGDGSNTPSTPTGMPTEGYGFLFEETVDGKPYYKAAQYFGQWPEEEPDPEKQWAQYHIVDFQLVEGQKFCLYDFGSQAGWTIDLDGWSFGGTSSTDTKWQTYLSKTSTAYTVLKTFNAKDIYIKLKYEQDNLYMTAG